jgi:hypothetical protein
MLKRATPRTRPDATHGTSVAQLIVLSTQCHVTSFVRPDVRIASPCRSTMFWIRIETLPLRVFLNTSASVVSQET